MILGIDPGYGKKGISAGIASVVNGRVANVGMYKSDGKQAGSMPGQVMAFAQVIFKCRPEVVVCDSFYPHKPGVFLAGGKAQSQVRGHLSVALAMLGIPLAVVDTASAKTGLLGFVPGMTKAERDSIERAYIASVFSGRTNEHNRDAVLHALWYHSLTTSGLFAGSRGV